MFRRLLTPMYIGHLNILPSPGDKGFDNSQILLFIQFCIMNYEKK